MVRFQSSSGSQDLSYYIKIVRSETINLIFQKTTSVRPEKKNPSTFPRLLHAGLRRKLKCLPEIISASVVHPNVELS